MTKEQLINLCKERRKNAGITQISIANQIGWPKTRISEFESGKANYSIDKLLVILPAYGLSIS